MYLTHILTTVLMPLTLAATTPGTLIKRDTKTTPILWKTKASASKDPIDLRSRENSNANKTHGAIITTRFDSSVNPEEQCQCIVFSMCVTEDVIPVANECGDSGFVCCRLLTLTQDEPTPTTIPRCGMRKPSVSSKISAPEDLPNTSFGEFPWMALILTNATENVFSCGASLISPSIVLTAAHCVVNFSPKQLTVRVGEYNINGSTGELMPHQDRVVLRITMHEDFNHIVLLNDIALLKVTNDFVLASHISPICVPFTNFQFGNDSTYDPTKCLATGWGKNAVGKFQTILKKVDLTLIPQDECENRLKNTALGSHFKIHPSFICAVGQPGFDTCKGDGGGPLVCESTNNVNKYVQVGIVSWGLECGSNAPAVYASLYAMRDWLTEKFNTLSDN